MANIDEKRSIFNLVADVVDDAAHLFQSELRLIRAEIDEKLGLVANAGGMLVAGGIAALAAFLLLLQAAVRWLVIAGLPDQWGYLLVGIVVTIVAAALLIKGINNLTSTSL